jgi:16S rRNA U516 pseudouridylate synthase RsuA-like enzyme
MKLIDILCRNVCLPRSEIDRQIKMGLVFVNGEPCTEPNKLFKSNNFFNVGQTVDFFYWCKSR